MKSHPRAGVDMLDGSQWSPLVKAVVLRHHERWNGTGYPDGKAGDEIHQMARIAAVADVYDAITSERLYAPARPASDGVRAIIEGSGTLFDPEVVDAFCKVVAPFPPAPRSNSDRWPHGHRGQRSRQAPRPPGGSDHRRRTARHRGLIAARARASASSGWDHQSVAHAGRRLSRQELALGVDGGSADPPSDFVASGS